MIFKLPAITTVQRTGLVLGARELVFDTTINQVFRGDGATLGGLSLAGISDGDKGDVVVSGGGVVWTLDAAIQATLRDRATHTGTQLSTTVSDFAEAVDDRVAAMLTAGTNITLTYNDVANTLTIAASGGGGVTDGDKGDITVATGGTVWTVDAGAITLAKMADIATSTLLGRITAATGIVEALTPAQGRTVLGLATIATSASAADLTAGILPAARFDDTAHGARAGGTTHANAVAAGAAGFMTGADKTKLDGVATGANLYVHPNHSGDVTSVADGAQTIVADAVTNAKLANVNTSTIKGRVTAAVGDPEDLTPAQVRTLINVADGAQVNVATDLAYTAGTRLLASSTGADVTLPLFSGTDAGLVPLSGGGTANFLRADGTFAAPAGGGDMVLASAQTNSALKTFLSGTFGLRNVANTFTALFTNAITAARTYTLKDADGTIAFVSDITGVNSGTNTGDQTTIVAISSTKAQFNTAVSDGDILFVGDAPTAHTHLLAAGATDVTMTAANLNILDDGLNTALHFHDADRARGVHTGTQLAATISDFSTAADARIGAASINALADVIITAPSATQVLKYNGTNWINDTDATGGGGVTDGDKGDVTVSASGATWRVDPNIKIGLPIVLSMGAFNL